MGENRRRHPMDFPPSAQQIKFLVSAAHSCFALCGQKEP